MSECRKIQCKFNVQEKNLLSLEAAIKELLSLGVEKIELCYLSDHDVINGHCETASRLLKR